MELPVTALGRDALAKAKTNSRITATVVLPDDDQVCQACEDAVLADDEDPYERDNTGFSRPWTDAERSDLSGVYVDAARMTSYYLNY
jgi:hypothetical protein